MSERAESGGGDSRPQPHHDETTIVRYEEEPSVSTRSELAHARVRRLVDEATVRAEFPRQHQNLVQERVPVDESDSGKIEMLPDGSVSVPLFEEELLVTKRTVLRERIIIRKESVTDWETVEAELRRERISFHGDNPEDSNDAAVLLDIPDPSDRTRGKRQQP